MLLRPPTLAAFLLTLLLPSGIALAQPGTPPCLSLAGSWQVRIDEADEGLTNQWFTTPLQTGEFASLPGSLAQSDLGHPFNPDTGRYEGLPNPPYLRWPSAGYTDAHRRDDLGVLVAAHMTYGPAWFERLIEVPQSWTGRDLRLSLERVKWRSDLWLDGLPVTGTGTRGLYTPHVYELGQVAPGPHRLTLRIDNRPQQPLGIAGHGYGMETEPLWLGVAGAMDLVALARQRVERVTVHPAEDFRSARIDVELGGELTAGAGTTLQVQVVDPDDERVVGEASHRILPGDIAVPRSVDVKFDKPAQAWDEFTPKLYDIRWNLLGNGQSIQAGSKRVGFRLFSREGRHITLNGKPIFLRGNLDCAIHPDSQTPPTDRAWWERVLGIHQQAGFNHIRFHTWCPPDTAFEVADELGLYLQVETTYWVDDWVANTEPHPRAFGTDPDVDAWVEAEALRIIRQFEHHPSFALFCVGNEFGMKQTDWGKMQEFVARMKAATDHVLVTGTTARRSLAADDYWVTHNSGAATRGIGPARTDWDFAKAVDASDKPVISHETGQRPSWPDYATLLPRFDGVMQPWNLRRLQARDEAAGCTDHERRAEASARFALVQYKSEHEGFRRTRDLAGYQLLMLHDFTGQGEALVGLLDPFFRVKPGITLDAIRAWNGPTVPLARFARYTWNCTETFLAQLQVAHEGPGPIEAAMPKWELATRDGHRIAGGSLPTRDIPDHALTDLGPIEVTLESLTTATALRLTLEVGNARNQWNLWAYPSLSDESEPSPDPVLLTHNLDQAALTALAQGESVVLLTHGTTLPNARQITWASTYWTGAWGWGNGMGLLIDADHPALAGFPTDTHSDWQWHDLVQGGQAIRLPAELADDAMIVEQLADFHKPAREACLCEVQVGAGRLLVCGLDLSRNLEQRPAARALRSSLLAYAATGVGPDRRADRPATITVQEAISLFRGIRFGKTGVAHIEADASHPGSGPENVLDGNPNTIWHTPWGNTEPPHPHSLFLDLGEPRRISGLHLLPRQDSSNGRFKEVAVYASAQDRNWGDPVAVKTLEDNRALQQLSFPPQRVRFLKLEIRSEVADRPWASLAELAVIDAPNPP
ncbi:MAG: discoidin domain-containing protein, partial [Verrucomicrobiae bacterium]|nr:discoidin domain-containing protein [Verrucomicrobiae bacterium]